MKKKKEVIVEDEIKLLKEAIIKDMSDGLWGLGVNKLPKFNLKKINSKEVLDLFNAGDNESREKAVSILYKAYGKRYLEIGKRIDEESEPISPYKHEWDEWNRQIRGDSKVKENTESKAQENLSLKYLFLSLNENKTKPTSEEQIGAWLDEYVIKYAHDSLERLANEITQYWWNRPPPKK